MGLEDAMLFRQLQHLSRHRLLLPLHFRQHLFQQPHPLSTSFSTSFSKSSHPHIVHFLLLLSFFSTPEWSTVRVTPTSRFFLEHKRSTRPITAQMCTACCFSLLFLIATGTDTDAVR